MFYFTPGLEQPGPIYEGREKEKEKLTKHLLVLQTQQVVSYQMYIHVRALHIFLNPPDLFGKTVIIRSHR